MAISQVTISMHSVISSIQEDCVLTRQQRWRMSPGESVMRKRVDNAPLCASSWSLEADEGKPGDRSACERPPRSVDASFFQKASAELKRAERWGYCSSTLLTMRVIARTLPNAAAPTHKPKMAPPASGLGRLRVGSSALMLVLCWLGCSLSGGTRSRSRSPRSSK